MQIKGSYELIFHEHGEEFVYAHSNHLCGLIASMEMGINEWFAPQISEH